MSRELNVCYDKVHGIGLGRRAVLPLEFLRPAFHLSLQIFWVVAALFKEFVGVFFELLFRACPILPMEYEGLLSCRQEIMKSCEGTRYVRL